MFGLSKSTKDLRPEAKALYLAAMDQSRQPFLYADYDVPDTMNGRYDCLLVHIFVILNRLRDLENYQDLSQDLFDFCFADMDQALRETGVGDMGVNKRMKKMMSAFNGRMHAYLEALEQGDEVFADAVARNVYGSVAEPNPKQVSTMSEYLMAEIENLKTVSDDAVLAAHNIFKGNK